MPYLQWFETHVVGRRANMHQNALIFVVPAVALLTPWMQNSFKIVENHRWQHVICRRSCPPRGGPIRSVSNQKNVTHTQRLALLDALPAPRSVVHDFGITSLSSIVIAVATHQAGAKPSRQPPACASIFPARAPVEIQFVDSPGLQKR